MQEEHSPYERQHLLSSLLKIPHGNLDIFRKDALGAAQADPFFFAHLTAWNNINGKVRDSKVAFPVLAMRGAPSLGIAANGKPDPGPFSQQVQDNAVGALLTLGPRELVKAYHFSSALSKAGLVIPARGRRTLERGLKQYVAALRKSKRRWDRAVLQNRSAVKTLYAVSHTKPTTLEDAILFKRLYPIGSVFDVVRKLRDATGTEAASLILKHKIPMQVSIGSVQDWNDDVIFALLENATGNEVLNNTKRFERLGVFRKPELETAYRHAIDRGKTDVRVNTFKAGKTAKGVNKKLATKVLSVQRSQEKTLSPIEGNWLILADKSASMEHSIELSKELAGILAARVTGQVHLIFFDEDPYHYDVTGKATDEIHSMTAGISAAFSTDVACGLVWAMEKELMLDGIILVTDGGENRGLGFWNTYQRYEKRFQVSPSVNFLHVPGMINIMMSDSKSELIVNQYFEMGENIDYYSLPNIVNMMKKGRYTLLDQILETPLYTLPSAT